MESPVVVDKPPGYHANADNNNKQRGFPFEEEEGGAWSELAARHPDIAARLRQHPATWARKRRPSSQDADDFGDSFSGFPFDDIPPQFRQHLPSHWNRRFGSRDDLPQSQPVPEPQSQPQPQPQPKPQSQPNPQPQPQPQSAPSPPRQQTAATQTEQHLPPPQEFSQTTTLPQYGLRNTVDLGQKSPADPSLVDADERNQRSMSAPPESRASHDPAMSGQNHHEQTPAQESSNVRHIPIFVEGRDEPVINKGAAHSAHTPPPPQPPIDREQYFKDDPPSYHHPTNFPRSYGHSFYRQPQSQPFSQKVFPNAFARDASPQRSQSPKSQHHQEDYRQIPVQHEHGTGKPKGHSPHQPQRPQQQHQQHQQQQQQQQQRPPQQQQHHQQQQQAPPPQPPPEQPTPPPPKSAQSPVDPITKILAIQTDVLNLMTDVENFTGTKNDKKYLYLDEMLTRNLIQLDNIETEGKENIRNARKEAIKCINKCIAVLEAKAESNKAQAKDVNTNAENNGEVEMKEEGKAAEDGELLMNEPPKEEFKTEAALSEQSAKQEEPPHDKQPQPQVDTAEDSKDADKKAKKGAKSKKQSKVTNKVSGKEDNASKDCKADVKSGDNEQKDEAMQVDDKIEKMESQSMDVDGAASQ